MAGLPAVRDDDLIADQGAAQHGLARAQDGVLQYRADPLPDGGSEPGRTAQPYQLGSGRVAPPRVLPDREPARLQGAEDPVGGGPADREQLGRPGDGE